MEQFILTKKAQVWSLDLIIASIIFSIGIIILYIYAINYSPETKNQLNELLYEGNLASKLILSDSDIGILSDNKINQDKLNNFSNFDYQTKKNQIGLINNFYFTFEGLEINGNLTSYVGMINTPEVKNLIKITRLSIYKNKPIKFQLFVWNEF